MPTLLTPLDAGAKAVVEYEQDMAKRADKVNCDTFMFLLQMDYADGVDRSSNEIIKKIVRSSTE